MDLPLSKRLAATDNEVAAVLLRQQKNIFRIANYDAEYGGETVT